MYIERKAVFPVPVASIVRRSMRSQQTVVNIKLPHMDHAEYNHGAYSKNVTPILNNGICGLK